MLTGGAFLSFALFLLNAERKTLNAKCNLPAGSFVRLCLEALTEMRELALSLKP
jgi:hypothetical protein